jgi:aspartate ammonia-lyase
VANVAIDTTGIGLAVYELVKKFFPAVKAIYYSLEVKQQLIYKALSVVGKGRLEFDASWVDLAHSFMALKKVLTPSGNAVTYNAGRSDEIGHADLAWATMHALSFEPLEGNTGQVKSIMEIYG